MYVFSVPPIGNGPTRPIRGPTHSRRSGRAVVTTTRRRIEDDNDDDDDDDDDTHPRRPPVARAPLDRRATGDDVVIDKDWTTNDGRDATRRFYRGFASHRGGDLDGVDDIDERERGP